MILDILTVLFFVLGFALLFWMIGERRRDVLRYVTEPSAARASVLNLKFGGLRIDSIIADSLVFGRAGDGSWLCSAGAG